MYYANFSDIINEMRIMYHSGEPKVWGNYSNDDSFEDKDSRCNFTHQHYAMIMEEGTQCEIQQNMAKVANGFEFPN